MPDWLWGALGLGLVVLMVIALARGVGAVIRALVAAAVAIAAAGCEALPGLYQEHGPDRVRVTVWRQAIGGDGSAYRVRLPGERLAPPFIGERP